MALWEEHTNIIHPSFYQPSSLECVEQMRNIGKTNWEVRVHERLRADGLQIQYKMCRQETPMRAARAKEQVGSPKP